MSKPYCDFGKHVIDDDQHYYVVNPEGGYGSSETLCCEDCVNLPENKTVRQRLIDTGVRGEDV
jgi:hypothetical protein